MSSVNAKGLWKNHFDDTQPSVLKTGDYEIHTQHT